MKVNEKINSSKKVPENVVYSRIQCSYKNLSDRYKHKSKDFTRQFAHIYAARLANMKDNLIKQIYKKWGKNTKVARLVELPDISEDKCVVIGTLFKDQVLKPSILKEISEELQIVPQPSRTHFTSDSDKLILEDELQRIMLLGNVDVRSVVTGIICGVLGREDQSGKFIVEDVCWVGATPLLKVPQPLSSDCYLVLVSGLDLSQNGDLFTLHLMVDWLTGWSGDLDDQEGQSKVARLIIAGNSIRSVPESKTGKVVNTFNIEESSSNLSAVEQLDDILEQLVEYMPVDLMPGEFDPTNHSLAQQPLHHCMFPKASRYETFNGVTNPYTFEIEGRIVTGTSGQSVDDVLRYSDIASPLQALESTLAWGHLAPTAPDTLNCYPYCNEDPFIIECQPSVYFSGNQPNFETKTVKYQLDNNETSNTVLICAPSFLKTSTCVVVNLSTLNCHPMSFGISDSSAIPDK